MDKAIWTKWPDLRRDYDSLIISDLVMIFLLKNEMTWFEKGLRRIRSVCLTPLILERNDLIWEGITTTTPLFPITVEMWRTKWPDLRRDYDPTSCNDFTSFASVNEMTWFEKGLRLRQEEWQLVILLGTKWPDLRRDYDLRYTVIPLQPSSWNEMTWFEKGLRQSRLS